MKPANIRRLFLLFRAVEAIFNLLRDNFPSWHLILWFGPLTIVWVLFALYIAGWLKIYRKWPTGYTRKVVHVLVFSSASAVQYSLGLPGVLILGGGITFVTLFIILKGDGYILYEAVAREKDAPRRSLHLVLPYVATFLGGMLSNLFFPTYVCATGYLVTGLGDAAGEPVGTRWGKHKYRVLSFKGVQSYRTIEGSLGVFVASLIALATGYMMWSGSSWDALKIGALIISALFCTIIEALSPHGMDNFFSLTGGCLVSAWLLF